MIRRVIYIISLLLAVEDKFRFTRYTLSIRCLAACGLLVAALLSCLPSFFLISVTLHIPHYLNNKLKSWPSCICFHCLFPRLFYLGCCVSICLYKSLPYNAYGWNNFFLTFKPIVSKLNGFFIEEIFVQFILPTISLQLLSSLVILLSK